MPVWLIQIIVGLVLNLAVSLAEQAFAPKQSDISGYRGSLQTGGKIPLSFLVGTIGVAGKLEYRNTWGNSGGTPNAYLVDVISLGDLPISGFTGLFVNSESNTVSGTGHATQGYPVTEHSGKLWAEFYDGSQTTASSYLTAKFGSDADRPWLSDMVGVGIPYLTMTALIDANTWTGFPTYMGAFQGIPLYDPRQDGTGGGEGSQRWADPSTWAFSDNNIVIVYNILRGIHDNSQTLTTLGPHVWGGRCTQYQLPYDVWSVAMDACDVDIDLAGGGTEKQFRAGREISVNERPGSVAQEFLTGCNARIAHASGRWYVLVGVPDTADGSFTDADVLASEAITLNALPSLDDVINGATATYLEPAQGWELKETAPYYRSDLEEFDDGRQQLQGAELDTTFSGTQAQRIIKAAVEESRRFVKHVVPLPPQFGIYRPLSVVAWTSVANGYDAKLFLVTARTEAPNGNIVLGLQEIDPSDHDWSTDDESPLTFARVTTVRPAAIPMTGWDADSYTYPDAGGNGRRVGILVSYAGGLQDVSGVWIQIREGWLRDGETEKKVVWDSGEQIYDLALPDPVTRSVTFAGIVPHTDYEVRGRFISPTGSGRDNDWSDWLTVTTPDIGVTYADLDTSLRAFQDWIGVTGRNLTEHIQITSAGVATQDLANYADKLSTLDQMRLGDAAATAGYTEAVLLALGATGEALADALTAVDAAAGDVSAGFVTRMTSFAAPDGGWTRYGVQGRATVGDTWAVTASSYWDVKTDGTSRIVHKAAEHYFLDDEENVIALFDAGGASLNNAAIVNLTAENVDVESLLAENADIAGELTVGDYIKIDGPNGRIIVSDDS